MKVKDERLQNLVDEHRKRVLGDSSLKSAPAEYWEVTLATELQWSLTYWKSLSLEERAMIMARQYLKNFVDTIDAHYRQEDDNRKREKQRQEEEVKKRNGRNAK